MAGQVHAITADSLTQTHLADAVSLWQIQALNISDASHSHAIDAITATQTGTVSITVASLTQAHNIDSVLAYLQALKPGKSSINVISKYKIIPKDVYGIQIKPGRMRILKI